jgi:hypothetical protein
LTPPKKKKKKHFFFTKSSLNKFELRFTGFCL